MKRKLITKRYQFRDGEGQWHSTDAATFARGVFFKPARLLALPNDASVTLMVTLSGDSWTLYLIDEKGIPSHSKILDGREAGELAFDEVADALAEPYKDALAQKLSTDKLPGGERTAAALELARLELGDDEWRDEIARQAAEFVEMHMEAEVEAHIQGELREYDARRAVA